MAKPDRSKILSPFQRFEKLAKALFAIPKKEVDEKIGENRRHKVGRKKQA
jgi:hypothetical protein